MKAVCLASSSAGNCFLLTFDAVGGTHTLMVEAGIPPKEILGKLTSNGIMASEIEACLITHAHGDHCKAAASVAGWGVPVFASKETLAHPTCGVGGRGNALEPLKPTKVCDGVYVMAFPVNHDIEGAMGFLIKTPTETVLFINDSKSWDANLSAFEPDYVFIECNYWERQVYAQLGELRKDIESGELTELEKREAQAKTKQHERNINSHMSLKGCIRGLRKLNLKKCVAIFLMHLSDRYANEYEMKSKVEAETGVRTLVCKKQGGIK